MMGDYTTSPEPAEPAEGNVTGGDSDVEVPQPDPDAVVEAQEEQEADRQLETDIPDEVVTDLLQGKYSTDAAAQRERLAAAGYDPEAVKEAVQRRLAQRYE